MFASGSEGSEEKDLRVDLTDCAITKRILKQMVRKQMVRKQMVRETGSPVSPKFDLVRFICRQGELSSNHARILATSRTLQDLDLADNEISDRGAIALSRNSTLRTLRLSENSIENRGARALLQNSTLTHLDLRLNLITDLGDLTPRRSRLTRLNLSLNRITDEGAIEIAQCPTLTHLFLRYNLIGSRGAQALAQSRTLLVLDLSQNQIGDSGLWDLAQNRRLTRLNLLGNLMPAERDPKESCLSRFISIFSVLFLESFPGLRAIRAMPATRKETNRRLDLDLRSRFQTELAGIVFEYARDPGLSLQFSDFSRDFFLFED